MAKTGDKIGPYTLVSKLGRGAFGVVWLAERRSAILKRPVALKMPNDEDVDLEAVRREAEVWAHAAGHPNVLPIIDADVYDGQVVIASEYAPDGSLSAWLQRHGYRAPSVESAVKMVDGILSGLEHLHSKNIIHRDLKPDNILLQGETPRLADFGIARVIKTTNPYSITISGTPHYMAPEAYRGKRTEQTDLWAVGVILYQLLAGVLPFQQADSPSLMYAVLTEQPAPLPDYAPHPLRDLVTKSLDKDEERRFRTATEMRRALTQAGMRTPEWLPPTIVDFPSAGPPTPPTRRQGWDEHSFFVEAGERLKPHELEAVRRLYDYTVRSARVTWGTGERKGTFNAKFDHINSKSVYSVATNGDLYLNFAWLADSAAGAEAAKKLGQKLRGLRGFNLPDTYLEKYVTIPPARWVGQVSEFTSIVDDVVTSQGGGQVTVDEGGEEETVVRPHAEQAAEFTGDDEAYLRWLGQNPAGYVVNTARAMNPDYMVLHRATCPHISKLEPELSGGFTERGYVKVCSTRVEPLRGWVRRHGREDGSFSRECLTCAPLGGIAQIDEPVVAISIGGQYPNVKNADDLYHATRGVWRINKQRAERAVYALSIYRGVIKEAYQIDEWRPASPELYGILERLAGRQHDDSPAKGDTTRSEFVGGLAPQAIRDKYVGKRLPKRSYGAPILYFNC